MEEATGALTFLFSDIESSTRLWEGHPEEMRAALAVHDEILRDAIEGHRGKVIKTTGDGFMATFTEPFDALKAATSTQRALGRQEWGDWGEIRVRIGLHSGVAQEREEDFFGPTVNRASRLMAAGHGGQVLVSSAFGEIAGDQFPDGVTLRDLGIHRLKDLNEPEHIYQIDVDGLGVEFPPLVTLDAAPNNLPTLTSAFMGRHDETVEVAALIENGSRLITLLGPGGTGKTRLALQIGADHTARFANGVFFFDLSTESDSDESFANVARILNIDSSADEEAVAAVARVLSDQKMLLVLDNLEQIDSIGVGIKTILESCPGVVVLATSRSPLRVRGEQLYPIGPLSMAEGDNPTAEDVLASEAGQLFEERAQRVDPSFAITPPNAAICARMIRRLDGLPLGIELAAARLRLFSLTELEQRLSTQLDVLRSGDHDAPARQRTLADTIGWSYDLLSAEHQQLLHLLGVFASCTITDIETVAGDVGIAGDSMEGLSSLVDESLVRKLETPGRSSRFGLLETIGSFSRQKLEETPDEANSYRSAHAKHFADLAESLNLQLVQGRSDESRQRLVDELENLQIAWAFWQAAGDIDRLHQLLDPMWFIYDSEGWYQGVITLAQDLLAVLDRQPDSPEIAREQIALQTSLARAQMLIRGYTAEVEASFLEMLEKSKATGASPERFPVLRSLASLYTQRGEMPKAVDLGQRLLDIASDNDDPRLRIDANLVFGVNTALTGDMDHGLDHLNEAIAEFDPTKQTTDRLRLGPHSGIISLTSSAFLLTFQGYLDQARDRAEQALRDAESLGHAYSLAYALFHVSYFRLLYRDAEAAEECATRLLAIANQYDYQIWRALAMVILGVVEAYTGDPKAAMVGVDEGIEIYERLTTPPVFWVTLLQLRAPVTAMAGDPEGALGLIDEAIGLEAAEASGQLAELFMTKGDILAMGGMPEEANGLFHRALEASRSFGIRLTELRALIRIVASGDDGFRADLETVYETFTEGFDFADLVEARDLLSA